MAEHMQSMEPPTCPSCGEPMQILSALDGNQRVAVCGKCSEQAPIAVPASNDGPPKTSAPEPETNHQPAQARPKSKFRQLMQKREPGPPGTWPEELLEDLPEQTQALLRRAASKEAQKTSSLSEDYSQTLRSQGYVIAEDARGVRITGAPKGSGTSELSPGDLVRMAAEMDGGVLPQDKRRPCPQCQATILPNAQQCQWCGYVLPAPDES